MKNGIFVTNREIMEAEPYLIAKEINRRMNHQRHKDTAERLKRMLDNRPRYSKRIPIKLYMKFHTIEVIRWEIKTYKKWMWYTLEQDNEVRLKFRIF